MKVGLCLPIVNRNIDRSFFLSFMNMAKPDDCTIYVPRMEIYGFPRDIAQARNDLVDQALADDCTHIVMMDTDQIYPQDTIEKLLSHGKAVVGALVHRRYPPFAPLLYRGELGKYQYVPESEMFSGSLVSVDATGCGCICYRSTVFDAVDAPWFELMPGGNGKPVGEDIRFCSKLRAAGVKIFVDTSAQVDHITTISVNRELFKIFKYLNVGHTGAVAASKENEE